jgi:hypothetical protein
MSANISVVVPLYNKASYIKRTIQSILAQVQPIAEIIVIDDGSSDNGASIVKEMNVQNLTLFAQSNKGVSAARNKGTELATSDYVAFLDADDTWMPHYINEVQKLIEQFKDAVMFATAYAFENNNTIVAARLGSIPEPVGYLENYFRACVGQDNPVTASSVVIRKCKLVEIGGFPEDMGLGEDQYLWSVLACRHKIAYSSRISAIYNVGVPESASKVEHLELPPHVTAWQQADFQSEVPDFMQPDLQELISRHAVVTTRINLEHGRPTRARQLLRKKGTTQFGFRWVLFYVLSLLPRTLVMKTFALLKDRGVY